MDTYIHPIQQACFVKHYKSAYEQITEQGNSPSVLITEANPLAFLGSLAACIESEVPTFLGSPHWGELEWTELLEQVRPSIVLGEKPAKFPPLGDQDLGSFKKTILIPTGGTSGRLRFTIHSLTTLKKSADATIHFLGKAPLNSYCALPTYHIGGLMPFIRAIQSQGQICFVDLKVIQEGVHPPELPNATLSLVPTQLQRALQSKSTIEWLKTLRCIFLGGAPASPTLLKKARNANIPLCLTYGLTETGSMITALPVDTFLKGNTSAGKPLKNIQITIANNQIQVKTPSLFEGYFPNRTKQDIFNTQDIGSLDESGYLHIKGRSDDIIISGGKKVDLHTIEEIVKKLDCFEDVIITSHQDVEWGNKIIAIYKPKENMPSIQDIKTLLKLNIEPHKVPKEWIAVNRMPFNEKGKIDKHALKAIMQ